MSIMRSVYAHKTTVQGDSGNLGDMMGFHIADWILGAENYERLGIRDKGRVTGDTVALVGSLIAALLDSPARIVGGGLINGNSRKYGPDLRIEGVRGFLTQSVIARDAKVLPAVIGDPGLLLPRIAPLPPVAELEDLGFIIHDVDREAFLARFPHLEEKIVDNYAPRDEFVRQLSRFRAIVSTSLHGCIFAHAYGKPVAPFVLTDQVFGGDFKFRDHYSALGLDIRRLAFPERAEAMLDQVMGFPQPTVDQVHGLQELQLRMIIPALRGED